MAYRPQDVAYEKDGYFAIRVAKGWDLYRPEGTHSIRCGFIGFSFGLDRVKTEIDRQIQRRTD